MTELRALRTWLPALHALVEQAPDGVDLVEYTGVITPSSLSGSYRLDGTPSGGSEFDEPFDLLTSLVREAGLPKLGVVLRAARSGRREVDLIEYPPSVDAGVGEVVGDLLLVDGALPALYRRAPDLSVTARPAPTADPKALARLVRAKLPDARGATDTELAAAEERAGVPLTEEVRALYRTAAAGELIVGDDTGFYGMEIIPLADRALRDSYLPAARVSKWEFGALTTLGPDPSGRIQPLAGSPTWFPVGHDWGGNVYAVDLTPAARGDRGQVIFLDHELNAGATLVSRSLTDLLVRGEEENPTGPVDGAATMYVNARSGITVADAARRELEALSIGRTDGLVDLTPVLGHPRLRTLTALPGTLADPLQVTSLPTLEYLSLGIHEWHALLEAGQVPGRLLAAGIEASDLGLAAVIATANALLARWDRPLIRVTPLR